MRKLDLTDVMSRNLDVIYSNRHEQVDNRQLTIAALLINSMGKVLSIDQLQTEVSLITGMPVSRELVRRVVVQMNKAGLNVYQSYAIDRRPTSSKRFNPPIDHYEYLSASECRKIELPRPRLINRSFEDR